jgi:hypothetical protein
VTSADEPTPYRSRRRRQAAQWTDVALVALFGVAVLLATTGGFRWASGVFRFSMTSPSRPVVLAAVLFALRRWFAGDVPLHPWLARPLAAILAVPGAGQPDEDDAAPARLADARIRPSVEWTAVVLLFVALSVFMTWPQAASLDSVPDTGDPLFSIWRLCWVVHQIPRDPLHLFDANIFYPELRTLAYSDAMLVPAALAAPLLLLGVHQLAVYNILLLLSFVAAGVSAYALVRRLTGDRPAAIVSGIAFAFYPFRFEHYPHFELQFSFWMPLALLALHRTLETRRVRDGVLTGLLVGLQALSSLYFGLFLLVELAAVGLCLVLLARRPAPALRAWAAGIAVVGILVLPISVPYLANRAQLGERPVVEARYYSAMPHHFLVAHQSSAIYGKALYEDDAAERELFPGIAIVALALVAVWPPLSAARLAYSVGAFVAVDGALGLRGVLFPTYWEYLLPFRGLRVPSRFSILVGLALAVLAGYGVRRLRERAGARRTTGAALALGCALILLAEDRPILHLMPLWKSPPTIYGWFDGRPPAVIADLPFPNDVFQAAGDAKWEYFSTFHWQTLIDGCSGFYPKSYLDALKQMDGFPTERGMRFLKRRGVQFLVVHGAFYSPEGYAAVVAFLDAHPDAALVQRTAWQGKESSLYRLKVE